MRDFTVDSKNKVKEIIHTLMRMSRDINYIHSEIMKRLPDESSDEVMAIVVEHLGTTN